jgi:hypothetical protein
MECGSDIRKNVRMEQSKAMECGSLKASPDVLKPRNIYIYMGTAVAQWLRCYATNRKVAGSIPDGVIGIFH